MAGARPGWQSRAGDGPGGRPAFSRATVCACVCVSVCGGEGLECGSPKNENGLGRHMSLPSLVLFLVESCKGRSTRREPSLYYSPHVEEKTGRRSPQIVSLNVSREGRYIF